MSKLVITPIVNQMGEKVTHFSFGVSEPVVSFNHVDRELAVKLDGVWFPVAKYPTTLSDISVKEDVVKAINATLRTDTFDSFMAYYEAV